MFVPKLVADGVGDPGDKTWEICWKSLERTYTRQALRRKCHPVVWTSKKEISVIEIPPEHIHTGGH